MANAARRTQPAPRSKIVSDGLDIHARNTVLSTMELLEMILCQVDMKTVLLAQRVNTKWRDIVGASLPLQRHLFFAPDPPVPGARTKPIHPPLHAPHLKHEIVQAWSQKLMARRHEGIQEPPILVPTPNPLLKENFACMFTMLGSMAVGVDGSWRGRASEDVNYLTTGKLMGMGMARGAQRIAGSGKPTSFLRAGASWRRMLVSQPPPRRIEHFRVPDGRRWDYWHTWNHDHVLKQYRSVNVPAGVTMGQLYDLVYAITFDRPNGRLSWVGWPDGRDFDPDMTPHQDVSGWNRVIWRSGSRLFNMSNWIRAREPQGHHSDLHSWASTDCIVVGEEGVGPDFDGFCREHYDVYTPTCQRCRQAQPMLRLKTRKRRLRKEVHTLAPFFRCEEYKSGRTLVEDEPIFDGMTASDSEADDSEEEDLHGEDDTDSLDEHSAGHTAALHSGDESSDDGEWDAASSTDENLP
jgi:hypothetical protein